jgi:hypothetical protein
VHEQAVARLGAEDKKFASSEESVGEFWLRKPAKHVIQGEFGDPERPISSAAKTAMSDSATATTATTL